MNANQSGIVKGAALNLGFAALLLLMSKGIQGACKASWQGAGCPRRPTPLPPEAARVKRIKRITVYN